MNRSIGLLSRVAVGSWLVGASAQELSVDPGRYSLPARFRVTSDVVNQDLQPFTATIGAIGNALVSASFEPATFRTRFFAAADAADRLVVDANSLTQYDGLREGFYDGADVRVYRIVNGKFEIVRRDRVPKGGSALSGWVAVVGDDKLVADAPEALECSYSYRFDDWNRPGVPYWFTVTAVDREGRESPHAEAISVVWQPTLKRTAAAASATVAFKPPKVVPEGKALAAPTGLRGEFSAEDGTARLSWTALAVDGLAGYRVYRSDYPPAAQRGHFLLLEGGVPAEEKARTRKGDWIVLDKTFTTFSRNQHHTYRVWGSHQNKAAMPDGVPFYPDEDDAKTWTLDPHPADSPVAEGGATALKIVLKEGAKAVFDQYNHAGTGQTWYEVLDPAQEYVVEFWARQADMATPRATFKLNGRYSQAVKPIAFELTGEWQRFRATFRVPDLYKGEGGVGQTSLTFEGPGTVWLDNYRVYAGDAPFLDYRPYEYADLKASGMGMLRTHAFIKTGTATYSMEQFTNPGGVVSGLPHGNTLPQNLEAMGKAGVDPWLQVEMHMTPEEWLGFVEYLAAPYDPAVDSAKTKPWAAKRHAQGRTAPWTDAFQRIFFEISNETWNWLFNPWVFEGMTDGATGTTYNRGEVYGLFQEHVIDCLRQSPYWAAAALDKKVDCVLGGWEVQQYGVQAAPRSPRSRYVTRAGYNGGWDEGEGPAEGNDASLFRALIQAGQSALPSARKLRETRDALRAEGKADFLLGTYEAGPGYALSGLNKQARMSEQQVRAQEETMKSLAAGTATLDTFLGRAANDFDTQNFFTYYHGRSHWVSHTAWHAGPRAHPCWMTLALFNNEGRGDMLAVEAEGGPTVDLPAYKRRREAKDVPLTACYATRKGDRLNLFVLSRKMDRYPQADNDGFTPVTVALPLRTAAKVTLFRMVGDPRSHNLDEETVLIERVELPASVAQPEFAVNGASGADARGLPPGATLLYVFEGIRE